jgi:hypothetical protein
MDRQFDGVWIPSEIWLAEYKSLEERRVAIGAFVAKEYGLEIALAGGFINGK